MMDPTAPSPPPTSRFASDEARYGGRDDDASYRQSEPLMTTTGPTGGIRNDDLGGGFPTTASTRQRRGGGQQQQRQEDAADTYSFASSPYGTPPPQMRQPLQSLTVGGYGPVSPSSVESSSKDSKGHRWPSRVLHGVSLCLRNCGCSGYEMRLNEGPDGKYYRDDFNDESWSCSLGTGEENGIWMNTRDQAGTIMAFMVWILLGYSALTMVFLAKTGGVPPTLAMIYTSVCILSLACHAKTTFTDPGTVPQSAVPREAQRRDFPEQQLSMCSQCQTFKPPFSHHCRICNRCVSRMDHHCPWMNNCIGAGNMKHFLLFLLYTWTCSAFALCLLGWNYFFCADEDCTFNTVLTQLVRVMTILAIGSFLFTSSMLMNVFYGLMTGIGTIDRLKKKANGTMAESEEEPIPMKDVFGIAGYHTWPFPVDPVFEDYDLVMGYSTPQRLLREQMRENPNAATSFPNDNYDPSVISKDFLAV